MKWVLVHPGSYKFVEDSDERPAVKLKSPNKHFKYAPSLKYIPTWRKYEEAMTHPLSKNQGEATDKFVAEREHQMKTDPIAKRWEESRKERVAKDKPAWRKAMIRKGEV